MQITQISGEKTFQAEQVQGPGGTSMLDRLETSVVVEESSSNETKKIK